MVTVPGKSAKRVLCVGDAAGVREGRCNALERAGYQCITASSKNAEILLSHQKFDIVVISAAEDFRIDRVINVSDGAMLLVVEDLSEMDHIVALVSERLAMNDRAQPAEPA